MAGADVEAYVPQVHKRLREEGFAWTERVHLQGEDWLAVAYRSQFSLTKFGNCEEFFVLRRVSSLRVDELRAFSATAFRYATAHKKSWLPRGFCESIFVFPMALCDSVDEDASRAIRESAPVKHWAAAEIPVALDLDSGELHYFTKTPLWGAAYWSGFREKIRRFLAP